MDEQIKFQFDIYQHRFKQPLRTNHGVWQIREGIIISLTNHLGIVSRGEIAPLPWFGSETMEQARKFCHKLGTAITKEDIQAISDNLPCCQFALESAWLNFDRPAVQQPKLDCCYLLPIGKEALTTWKKICQSQTINTFKWKIGVLPLTQEIEILQQLNQELPPAVKLRLDANGGLNRQQAQRLLSITDSLTRIEFVEQPLSPDKITDIMQLSQEYTTLLALDESVASFKRLQIAHQQGWQGVYVIKAAIMGFPSKLRQFCQDNSLDVVFSSVFETEVARNAVLDLAHQVAHPRAVGFGVEHFAA